MLMAVGQSPFTQAASTVWLRVATSGVEVTTAVEVTTGLALPEMGVAVRGAGAEVASAGTTVTTLVVGGGAATAAHPKSSMPPTKLRSKPRCHPDSGNCRTVCPPLAPAAYHIWLPSRIRSPSSNARYGLLLPS